MITTGRRRRRFVSYSSQVLLFGREVNSSSLVVVFARSDGPQFDDLMLKCSISSPR